MTSSLSTIKEVLTPESWTMKDIGKVANASATALSKSAATISEKLYDHRLVDAFTDEQQRLQDETNSLRVELQTAKRLQKPERGSTLRSLKADATSLRVRTKSHVKTVNTSAQLHAEDREKALKEGRPPSESRTSWHPVHNWDPRLIDAINAMGPCSATLVKD